jgi:hypothetical protein
MTPAGKPAWSREASIGDYGGDPNKRTSVTEGKTPYAWGWYREMQNARGSAYSTQIGGTLVHCENLALARYYAYLASRMPEYLAANALPGSAGDLLDYWAEVLGVPSTPSDPDWQIRQRCAAHYQAVTGVTESTIRAALQALLGDVYVDATFAGGDTMSDPPDQTFWPGGDAGDPSLSIGGAPWSSERSHLWVEVQRPAGMTAGEYNQLVRVQAVQLLDRMLPAFCTFTLSEGGGFNLDVDRLDFTGLTTS